MIVVVEDLATYQAALDQGKTAPSVMYLILKERQVYFNGELWSKAPEEGGGGVSQEDFDALYDGVVEAEEVAAAALNEFNTRINELAENVSGQAATKEELNSAVETLNNTIIENEEITAAALNDLNTRLLELIVRLDELENV